MQALLTVILTWVSLALGVPESREPPRVEYVSAATMTDVRQLRLATGSGLDAPRVDGESAPEVSAFYDDATRTLYLPKGWSASSPADVSLLVHELVHHVQNESDLAYECPEAREKAAYELQARWLEMFGKSLMDEFDLDEMTVMVRTRCMH